jgi:hypothetical protein
MLYMGGATLQEIGDVVGVTGERVRQILRSNGIKPRTSLKQIGPILRAYDVSKTTKEIAAEAGRDKDTTRRVLHALGLPRRNAWQKWTQERIVTRLQDWAREHGRQPLATDLLSGHPAKRDYPSPQIVRYHFGKWNAAIKAAGFKPFAVGHKRSERVRALAREWRDA